MRTIKAEASRTATALALAAILSLAAVGCRPGDASRDQAPAAGATSAASAVYDAETAAAIARIENNLLPPTPVVGESGWTMAERMDRYNVEGVSVAVIHDFEVVWAKAYGLADREEGIPVTTETLFQAGSISKPVGATGTLRLVEEGQLDLDTPINEYLTSWQLPDNELTAQTPVTIRRLLSHTAGTTVHGFPGYAVGDPVPTVPQVLDGEAPTNTAAVRVDIEPGGQYRYSGGGTTIVQLAVTDVTGEAYPDLLRRLVLEPAGMEHSTYQNPLPPGRLSEAAAGYYQDGSPVPGKRHTYPEMQAAGLWTTATDLARFAIAMQNSLRGASGVLKTSTAEEMTTPVLDQAGLGFFVFDEDGTVYFGHNGADEGFQALLLASFEDGNGIAVMANSENGGAIADEIMDAVAVEYGWDGMIRESVVAVDLTDAELAAFESRYRFGPGGVASMKVEDGALVARVTLQPTPSRMFALGDDVFLNEELGEKFRFVRDEEGEVVAIEALDRPGSPEIERIPDDRLLPVELIEAGRTDEALALLTEEEAEEADVNLFGYTLLTAGWNEDAVAIFEWNAERNPTHANPWDSLADGYLAVGDTASAITAYRTVLETLPLDTDAVPGALVNLEQRARSQLAAFGEE